MQFESDLVQSIRARSDKMKAIIMTSTFQFEGSIHTPKVGKESRRLSDTLNNAERQFVAMTDVMITDRRTGLADPHIHKLIQVSVASIEYVKPLFDDLDDDEKPSLYQGPPGL